MNTPIFPQVVYPIGNLPDGMFIAEVGARGFQYVRELSDLDYDLPELGFDDDEPDTIPPPSRWEAETTEDDGPPTMRPQEIERQPWYRRALAWCRAA